jgi:deoxycytidylate deaminase
MGQIVMVGLPHFMPKSVHCCTTSIRVCGRSRGGGVRRRESAVSLAGLQNLKPQKENDMQPKLYNNHNEFYAGADLYVFRFKQTESGEWEIRNSKPCADCAQLIKKSRIRKVYYSTYDHRGKGVEMVKATHLRSNHISFGRRPHKKK